MGSLNGTSEQLPIIDISNPDSHTGDRLLQAASEWGFVYIKNQGLGFTPEILDRTFGLSRQFFKSPTAEKAECAIGPDDKGWSSPYAEVLDPENQTEGDFKEALNFGEFANGKAQQPLPKSLTTHEAEISRFADLCHALCIRILDLVAIGLKVDDAEGGQAWFSSRHNPSKGPSGTILRLCYYPALELKTNTSELSDPLVRANSHTDFGSLTLLFQSPSQSGLEILNPSSSWSPVAVHPPSTENDSLPPIVMNIGDLLSRWTNGVLKSTVHRVNIPRNRKEDRYSIAYFCHPVADTRMVPVPSKLIGEKEGAKNGEKVLTAKEHLTKRLAEVYGWKDEPTT